MKKHTLVLSSVVCLWLTLSAVVPAQAPDTQWTKQYGTEIHDEATAMHPTSDGGYILVGHTADWRGDPDFISNAYLVKTDANGDTLWTQVYGNSLRNEAYNII
ncbi:MAG: hypothetical protein GY839_03410 [candidate division Zixibacteria bacterium]|nr:hypothetical protein [candidate division Zixibacteria bacterium]